MFPKHPKWRCMYHQIVHLPKLHLTHKTWSTRAFAFGPNYPNETCFLTFFNRAAISFLITARHFYCRRCTNFWSPSNSASWKISLQNISLDVQNGRIHHLLPPSTGAFGFENDGYWMDLTSNYRFTPVCPFRRCHPRCQGFWANVNRFFFFLLSCEIEKQSISFDSRLFEDCGHFQDLFQV